MSLEVSRNKVLRREAVSLDVPASLYVAQSVENRRRGEKQMAPRYVNAVQWHQALGYAPQVCARFFRDGGTPADAVRAFNLTVLDGPADWSIAVDRIAQALCTQQRKAA
jgi:hypothetical protein